MNTYTYYRAMSKLEANKLITTDTISNGTRVSYWADSLEVAKGYKLDGRVVVKLVLDRDLNAYRGVAFGETTELNHIEYVVPMAQMNLELGNMIEDATIVA